MIGTIRRECLDHVIVFSKAGLSRHLRKFVDYYHRSRTPIPPEAENVRYIPPGFLIYSRDQTLLAQPFDATKLQFTGEPFPIAEHVARIPQLAESAFSVSETGVLMYRSSGFSNDQQLAWYGPDGKRLQTIGEPGEFRQMVLSPDEKRLVVERSDPLKGGWNLWLMELSTGILSRLTFDARERDAVWSPDGRELMFSSNRIDKPGLYRKMVGGGDEKLVYGSRDGVSAQA